MSNVAAYDLAPLLGVVGFGMLFAVGPLAWFALRHRATTPAARLRALALLTLFLSFDLVLLGAYTRLSDSGLGCPDWPGCYGHASPVGAQAPIAEAHAAMPSGPVSAKKAWIEMAHRYSATAIGLLIIALVVLSWRASHRGKAGISPWWAVATLTWVSLQGAFGALTVTMSLYPAIVTLHLLGGLLPQRYAACHDAGDGQRRIEPAELRLGEGDRRCEGGRVAGVGDHGEHAVAAQRRQLLAAAERVRQARVVGAHVGGHHRPAGLRERPHRGRADAAGGAGDEGYPGHGDAVTSTRSPRHGHGRPAVEQG